MEQFLETIQSQPLNNILWSMATIVTMWLIRNLILRTVEARAKDATTVYNWRKSSANATVALGALIVVGIWLGNDSGSLATYFGLLSAGLAISLQDPITNLIGWLFILTRHPFDVGDRIEIGDHAGDVIDIRFFQFTLLEIGRWVDAEQSTGRILHMPNRMVFIHAVANYSKGFQYIWNEIPVDVTFESDWQKAKSILLEIAKEHGLHLSEDARKQIRQAAKRYLINYDNVTPTVYTTVTPSGVRLTLRYLCPPRQRRNSEQEVWENVLKRVAAQDDIDFAYPTQRIYYHPIEGKTLQVEPHVQVDPNPIHEIQL